MVYTCFLCKWRSDRYPRRSYHKFPINAELKQKWLDILGKSNVSIGSRTTLCSIHFEEECFRYGLVNGRRILKDGSLPTLHLKYIKQKPTFDSIDEIKHPEPPVASSFHADHTADVVRTEPQTYKKGTEESVAPGPKNFSWQKPNEVVALLADDGETETFADNLSMYWDDEDRTSLLSQQLDGNCKGDPVSLTPHEMFRCNVCDSALTGFRYTCVQCSDLDLCGACEAARAHHHHYVLRVPADRHATEVQFVLATIRRYLKTMDPKTVSEPYWEGSLSIKSEIKSECEDDDEMIPTAGQASDRTVSWAACEQKEHTNCFTNMRIKLETVNENDTVHFSCADEGDNSAPINANGMIKKENDAGTECGTFTSNACATSNRNYMQDEATSDVADDSTPSKRSKSIKPGTNFKNLNDSKFMQTYRMSKGTVLEICS